MRWTPFIAVGLVGCSILYNPNNIPEGGKDAPQSDSPGDSPKTDAPPIDMMVDMAPIDMMIDAPPEVFALQNLYPTQMLEGQGVGGSRRVPLLIRGQNISSAATVTLTATSGPAIDVTVHNAEKLVNAERNTLVVPITVNVAPTRGMGMTSDVTVTVTQMGMAGMESQMLTTLRITYLDELTTATHPTGTIAPGTYRSRASTSETSPRRPTPRRS